MTSKVYGALKFIALVLLPGTSTLYVGLAEVWDLPYVVQVVGTIAAVDTFLGLIVKKSSSNYKEQLQDTPVVGNLKVYTDLDGVPTGRMGLPGGAFDGVIFEDQKLVALRVKREIERR